MHMLYKAVVLYAILWKDKLFYSYAITYIVLNRGKEKRKKLTYFSAFKL